MLLDHGKSLLTFAYKLLSALETNSWHYDMAASADTAPEARYGHCSVVSNHSMWVCGGFTGLKPQSDVNVWDFGKYASVVV